eukprot:8447430-Alexandrium_andersonii.AAC.1
MCIRDSPPGVQDLGDGLHGRRDIPLFTVLSVTAWPRAASKRRAWAAAERVRTVACALASAL